MRIEIRIAAAVAMLSALSACSDSTDPGEEIPVIDRVAVAAAPTPPTGTHVACFTNQDAQTAATTCPVIRWKNITYWAFTYDDNRQSFNISGYNEQLTRVKEFEKVGARNVWEMEVDVDDERVIISGESGLTANVDWEELEISGS